MKLFNFNRVLDINFCNKLFHKGELYMIRDVNKILRKLPYGATEPVEGIIDGENVIIKTFKNRWGYKILINEYICLKIAMLLKLPIPDGGICNITKNTELSEELKSQLQYDDDICGIGFYSKRLSKVTKFICDTELVKAIKNKEDMNKILLFDYLIYNEDRHNGNILLNFSKNESKMYIIDHSHVFNLQNRLNERELDLLMQQEDYKDNKILITETYCIYKPFIDAQIITKEKLISAYEIFKSLLNNDILEDIIKDLPQVWITDKNDLKKLKEYILYRLQNMNNIIEQIAKNIVMSGGE